LKLQALDRFLKQYPKLTAPPTPDTRPTHGDHEAWKVEQQSFANLHELVSRSIEAIAFLSILIDFRLSTIAQGLKEHDQKELKGLSFEMLVTTAKGREVAKALMTALVNNHINKELGVESVILSLQQRCATICESNDVILYQGLQHLRNAQSIANQGSAGQHLQEALRLFLSISKHISMPKIHEIIDTFKSLHYFQGVVDLALQKAADFSAVDGFVEMNTSSVEESNQLRLQSYDMIFQALSTIDALGTATVSGRGRLSKEDARRIKNMVLKRALESDDRLFHQALYAWFIAQNWVDQLLEIQSPYLEQYLLAGKNDLKIADYLSRFYVRRNRFFESAQLLTDVAHYPGLSLDERLVYLTTALTNARSSSSSNTQELLSQLTDELDVARVQSEIIIALRGLPNTEQDLEELNSDLMDIGTLFSKYARVHKLYEIMLQIFFISDHSGDRSQAIIENCWEEIFSLTMKAAIEHSRSPFDALADKVRELGRKFYPDDSVFPLSISSLPRIPCKQT
jgi:nuclear pore complex protein Nup155